MRIGVVSMVVALAGCADFVGVGEGDASTGDTAVETSTTGSTPTPDPTDPAQPTSGDSATSTSDGSTTFADDSTTGTSSSQTSTSGDSGTPTYTGGEAEGSSSSGPANVCGDSNPTDGEACDDGNADELDGCTSACIPGPTGIEFGATFDTDLEGGGSTTAITNATENCPPSEVLVGLRGGISSEGWIGVLGGVCRPAGLTNTDPPAFETSDPTTELPEHGQFQSGGPWQTECADDQAIVAVNGGAGDVMDGIRIRCAQVDTVGDPGNYGLEPTPTDWLPLQGGSEGDEYGPLTCPDGTVATGVQTENNSYIIRIRLLCREISLAYP